MPYALVVIGEKYIELFGTFYNFRSCMEIASKVDGMCISLQYLAAFNQ